MVLSGKRIGLTFFKFCNTQKMKKPLPEEVVSSKQWAITDGKNPVLPFFFPHISASCYRRKALLSLF